MPRRLGVTLNPQIFRRAALRIHLHKNCWCCAALEEVCWSAKQFRAHVAYLEEWFQPPTEDMENRAIGVWWAIYDREVRVIALLLLADILEARK